jgi:hypothetical protein
MDDYKRTLYMRAQRLIKDGEQSFVCLALREVLLEDGHHYFGQETEDSVLKLFAEFGALYDGTHWECKGTFSRRVGKVDSWWSLGWTEPRIRALDCILRESS